MAATPELEVRGLYRTPNQLSAPRGSTVVADNCVIRSRGQVEPRRGQPKVAVSFTELTPGNLLNVVAPLEDSSSSLTPGLIGHAGAGDTGEVFVTSDGGLLGYLAAANPPDPELERMKFAPSGGATYFTTDEGIRSTRFPGAGLAGIPAPFVDWHNSHVVTDANGFLEQDSAVAYWAVLGKDANGRRLLSAPSDRTVLANPAPIVVPIGGLVRSFGVVTITTDGLLRMGDVPTMSPGEANFAAGAKTITGAAATGVSYTEAGAGATSTVAQTFAFGDALCRLRVTLPDEADTDTFVQLYRSEVTGAAGTNPSENAYLVYQAFLTSADVSAGYVDIDDNTPEVLLGESAYFSPEREGLVGANNRPLLAHDLTAFGEVLVAGNLREKHQLEVRLLAIGGTEGLSSGDMLGISDLGASSGMLFVFGNTYGPGMGINFNVPLYRGGGISQNIELTARALVAAVNAHASNDFIDAYYVSGVDDAPGIILFRRRTFAMSEVEFVCTASPNAWNPVLDTDAGGDGANVTLQRIPTNAVAWSKASQPDAWPSLNYQEVGPTNEAVLRVLALKENVVILKERSAWVMSGVPGSFQFQQIAERIRIEGADNACVANNQVVALTSQGVAAIGVSGLGLYSLPIELDFTRRLAELGDEVRVLGWMAAYETDRLLMLALPTAAEDTCATEVWCFSFATEEWTRWPVARRFASVDSEADRLWFADSEEQALRRERRGFEAWDYVDDELARTCMAISDATVTLDSNDGVEVGDWVAKASDTAIRYRVSEVSDDGQTVTVDQPATSLTTGAVLVLQGYDCRVRMVAAHMGAPGSDKRLQQLQLHMREAVFQEAEVRVGTDIAPYMALTARREADYAFDGFGYGDFGDAPFGNPSAARNLRTEVSARTGFSSYFFVEWATREAFATWKLQGLTPTFVVNGGNTTK